MTNTTNANAIGREQKTKLDVLQSEFLNIFPSKYREHIVEFAKNISRSDAEVLIFTARKAACFFHCLEYLKIWNSGNKIVTSERCKDHNLDWVKGKRVAIVDEVIVTGTNLSELVQIMRDSGAASVEIYALFINKDWFVGDLLNGATLNAFVPLVSAEAQALGTTIVEALHQMPRPYAVDYPITAVEQISESQFLRILDSTAWRPQLTYSKTNEHKQIKATHVEYYSFHPKFELSKFLSLFAIQDTKNTVCKIRLYGKWVASSSPSMDRAYQFRLVPYLILPPSDEEQIEKILNSIISNTTQQDRTIIYRSCHTYKSKLRFCQYILAAWIGQAWASSIQSIGVKISFTNDPREIHYIFPQTLHEVIQNICSQPRTLHLDIAGEPILKINPLSAPESTVENTFSELLMPFTEMYEKKEIRLRRLAKQHGRKVVEEKQYESVLNRLNEGLSIQDLTKKIKLPEHYAQEAVSQFLDVAIDNGHIVPVTISKISPDGKRLYFRGFRHGEETYLIIKDRETFWLMLSEFYREIASQLKGDPSIPSGPLMKLGAVSRINIEKILVLFLRYGLHEGIFNQAFTAEGASEGRIKVRVAADLHGARLAIGKELPTEMSQENAFVNWLAHNNILKRHKSGGFILGEHRAIGDGPDRTKSGKSKQFGILMANVVTELLKTPQEDERKKSSPAKRLSNTLIALSTCETASSTIIAVGAELRRVKKEFSTFPTDYESSPLDYLELISAEKNSFADARTAANSAYFKIKLYATRQSDRSIQFVEGLLLESTPMAASMWETSSEAFKRMWGRSTVKGENHFIIELLETVIPLQFSIHFIEYIILSANAKYLKKPQKQRLDKLPLTISEMLSELDELAEEFGHEERNFYETATNLIRKHRSTVSTDWESIQATSDSLAFTNRLTVLNSLIRKAEHLQNRIDAVYNQRGQIAAVRIYHAALFIFIEDTQEASVIRDLLKRACERSFSAGPRGYSKPTINSTLSASLTYRELFDSRKAFFHIYAIGPGAGTWLGYISAESIKTTQGRDPTITIGAFFGDENNYSALISAHDGILTPSSTLSGVQNEQIKTLKATGSSIIIQAEPGQSARYLGDFESVFDSVLKSDVRRNRRIFVQHSQQLGGTLESRTYNLITTNSPHRAILIFTVQDELSTYLNYLRESGITVRREAPSASEKMSWYATFNGSDGALEVIAVLNREMGSHDAAALLSEVERRFSPSIVVFVGIAASLSGKMESLGNVVIPTRVLDATQSLVTKDAERSRSFDRPFPAKIRELVQGFFVECIHRDKLRTTKFGEIEHKVLSNVIETDGALLRDESPDDRRRQANIFHSDKVETYEMEAAGVVAYLENNPNAAPTFIVKGLSDLGDTNKKDDEIRYLAARNAVVVALSLIDYVHSVGLQT